PARHRAVVAEQPGARGERGGGGLRVGTRQRRVPHGREQRPGAHHPGEVRERQVGPHGSGPAVAGRHRVVRRVPADPEPVGVDRPVPLPARRPGLPVQAVRRNHQQVADPRLGPDVSEVTAHQAPSTERAVRNPEKICRRTGRSQLRKVPRQATGSTANEPPRSTLYSGPKNTSEYSRYGNARNPGYGRKSPAVHSHTSPISPRPPSGGAPAG